MKTARIPATGQEFTIGKIVCLGRNYAEHARELGNETPTAPILFMKPATAVIDDGAAVRIPSYSDNCHHEVELAVLIGRDARCVSPEEALEYVAGYGVAIDMTLRDVQDQMKAKGLPWEIAKGFDTSCPLSDFVPAASVTDPHNLSLRLLVNGEVRQDATTAGMIHRVPQTVAHISGIFTLEAGDVILTGTPSGVSRVKAGDVMEASITDVGRLKVFVQ
ncbi:MAG: fumarylacetoacetate hydrolase family protein [Deltaproteobacteria bacterium]|nr:fumarylacetoacetate hydrolase family protein [Deltaproteobacteria bacterium]